MSRYFEFNTGRPYTEEGQIIRCYKEPSRVEGAADNEWDIWFYDVSRCIIGKVLCIPQEFADQYYVIGAYDFMSYEPACFSDSGIREIIRHFGNGGEHDQATTPPGQTITS